MITVGPLTGAVVDPFGIAERRFPVSGTSELTVLPRTHRVLALRRTIGLDDPHAGEQQANVLGLAGDEFYALRDYVLGDDMRRVHWPSTARRDELTVRQAEVPWQGRTTVVLDARTGTTTAESFELGVSAAASIITAAARQDDRARLVITDGTDTGYADTHLHVDNVMERLAIVDRHHGGTLADLAPTLERGQSGAIVIVTTAPTRYDIEALLSLRVRVRRDHARAHPPVRRRPVDRRPPEPRPAGHAGPAPHPRHPRGTVPGRVERAPCPTDEWAPPCERRLDAGGRSVRSAGLHLGSVAAAELALPLVTLATVAGFARLYDSADYFVPLAIFAVAGHGLASLCRHLRLSAWATAAIAVIAGGVLTAWVLFPDTLTAGLPTSSTRSTPPTPRSTRP